MGKVEDAHSWAKLKALQRAKGESSSTQRAGAVAKAQLLAGDINSVGLVRANAITSSRSVVACPSFALSKHGPQSLQEAQGRQREPKNVSVNIYTL